MLGHRLHDRVSGSVVRKKPFGDPLAVGSCQWKPRLLSSHKIADKPSS